MLLWLRRREKPCLGVRLTERALSRERESEPRSSFTPTLRSTSRTPLSDCAPRWIQLLGPLFACDARFEGGHQNSFFSESAISAEMGRPPDPMVTLRAMRALVAYAALLAMALVSSMSGAWASDSVGCHKTRPSPARRKFSSPEVDHFLLDTVPRLRDQIAQTFNVCLPNALDSTFVVVAGRDDSFVITGDIDAMWLRDSTFQVLPYVRYFLKQGKRTELSDAVCGLVRRQARSVLIDRYANAFNLDARGSGAPSGRPAGSQDDQGGLRGKIRARLARRLLRPVEQYLSRTGDAASFDQNGETRWWPPPERCGAAEVKPRGGSRAAY